MIADIIPTHEGYSVCIFVRGGKFFLQFHDGQWGKVVDTIAAWVADDDLDFTERDAMLACLLIGAKGARS